MELYLQDNALIALPNPFFPYIQILNVANNQIESEISETNTFTNNKIDLYSSNYGRTKNEDSFHFNLLFSICPYSFPMHQ
jgi:hypothetical protein